MSKALSKKILLLPIWLGLLALPLSYSFFFTYPFSLTKWCVIYFIVTLCLFNMLFFLNTIYFPKLNKFLTILGALIIGFFIFNLYYHKLPYLSSYLDGFCFLVLVLYFYQLFCVFNLTLDDLLYPILLATIIFLFFASKDFVLYGILSNHAPKDWTYSFGNTNMAAEFLGVSLVFQLYIINKNLLKNKAIIATVFTLTLVMIYYYICRSIYIVTGLSLLYVFLSKDYTKKREIFYCVLAAVSIVLCIEFYRTWLGAEAVTVLQKESASRMALYLDALNMLKQFPLGIGKGKYEFTSVPYSTYSTWFLTEKEVYKTPHDDFLRIAVEEGIPYAFALFTFIGMLFLNALRMKSNKSNVLIILTLGFMLVQMAFQFPLDNAFPFLFFALITSYLLVCQAPTFSLHINSWSYGIILALALLLGVQSTRFVASHFISQNLNDAHAFAHMSCVLDPNNWRACLDKARFENKSPKAFDTLRTELKNNPFNFCAIHVWAFTEFAQKQTEDACETFVIYDSLFANRSTLRNVITRNCPNSVTLSKNERHVTSSIVPVRKLAD